MDAAEFSQWLEGLRRLNGEQIALAIAKLGEFGNQAGRAIRWGRGKLAVAGYRVRQGVVDG